MKKGIPQRRARDVSFAEYERQAKIWRQLSMHTDCSVTDQEKADGYFMKIGGVLLKYIG